jgi:hypothetical protein
MTGFQRDLMCLQCMHDGMHTHMYTSTYMCKHGHSQLYLITF